MIGETHNIGRSVFCGLIFLGIVALVVVDSYQHFDSALIDLKKEAYSAQKNWNIHYGQSNVYLGGGIRHNADFRQLASILEPGQGLITDVSTSYYAASSLPLYVKNVHRHHGRHKSPEWDRLISHRVVCYLDAPENMREFKRVMDGEASRAKARGVPPVAYIAVNRTHYNDNFKRGCLSQRRRGLLSVIDQLGTPVFDGDTITLYRLAAPTP